MSLNQEKKILSQYLLLIQKGINLIFIPFMNDMCTLEGFYNQVLFIHLFIHFRSSVRDMSAKNRGCLFSDERDIPGSEVNNK